MELTQQFPERLAPWLERARLQEERSDLEAARLTLLEAQQRHPDAVEVELALADLQRSAGHADQAFASYDALSHRYPGKRDVFRGRLETALQTGRNDVALQAIYSAPVTSLKNYEVHQQEARVLYAMGRPDEAQRALKQVIVPPSG